MTKIQMYISSLYSDLVVCQRDLVKGLRAVPQIGLQRRKASATSTKRCKFCNSNSEFPCLCCLLYWSSDPTNEPQRRQKNSFPNSTGFHQTSQKHSLSQLQHLESFLLPIQILFKFYLSMHPPFQWQDTRTESCRKRSTMRATLSSERSFLGSQNVPNSLTEKRSLGKRMIFAANDRWRFILTEVVALKDPSCQSAMASLDDESN